MNRALTLPNQITLARLGLAIVFFILLTQYSQRDALPHFGLLDAAIIVFIVAAGSDFLDGYLARRFGQITALGRVLDPLVDKVLICGAFVLMAGPAFVDVSGRNVTRVESWMTLVIVGRELLVTGLRGFNESSGHAFGASLGGKIKMWMQSIAVPTILFLVARESAWSNQPWIDTLKLGLVWLTVLVTGLSMVQYLARSRHLLGESASA